MSTHTHVHMRMHTHTRTHSQTQVIVTSLTFLQTLTIFFLSNFSWIPWTVVRVLRPFLCCIRMCINSSLPPPIAPPGLPSANGSGRRQRSYRSSPTSLARHLAHTLSPYTLTRISSLYLLTLVLDVQNRHSGTFRPHY